MPNETKTAATKTKATKIHDPMLTLQRAVAYIVLFVLCFVCLFFFYVLIVNATHNNFTIQQGFDPLPRTSFGTNFYNTTHDANTLWPLILPSIAAPTVFFFMKQYMDSSLPRDIIDAARIDGSGEFHTFNAVILPILKPAMAVQAIFSFVGAWNNYFIPALIINDAKWKTVPILVAQLRSADFLKFDMGKVYMMITIAILPVMIVYLLLSKYIVRGVALGSVKG